MSQPTSAELLETNQKWRFKACQPLLSPKKVAFMKLFWFQGRTLQRCFLVIKLQTCISSQNLYREIYQAIWATSSWFLGESRNLGLFKGTSPFNLQPLVNCSHHPPSTWCWKTSSQTYSHPPSSEVHLWAPWWTKWVWIFLEFGVIVLVRPKQLFINYKGKSFNITQQLLESTGALAGTRPSRALESPPIQRKRSKLLRGLGVWTSSSQFPGRICQLQRLCLGVSVVLSLKISPCLFLPFFL